MALLDRLVFGLKGHTQKLVKPNTSQTQITSSKLKPSPTRPPTTHKKYPIKRLRQKTNFNTSCKRSKNANTQ